MWGVSEESDGLPGHRSLASLTFSLSPCSTAASAAGEGVLRAFVLHCTTGGCRLGWSLKLSGITSEQRRGYMVKTSKLGEGAVGWFMVGDEHHEHLGMFWQRVIVCLAAAETGQVTTAQGQEFAICEEVFPQ